MDRIDLCGKWQAFGKNEKGENISFDGTVPGCVHTDLIAAGIIDGNIYYRDNAKQIQWIENVDWQYKKEFEVKELGKGAQICFEGLDVYCDVYLNGKHIGYADDMFFPHRFSAEKFLVVGKNEIEVRFYSPVRTVSGKKYHEGAFTTERINTRRMQCTYGWDWVYRFVTCGIFKECYIEFEKGVCADSVYVVTESIDEFSAQISCDVSFKSYENGGDVSIEIYAPDGSLAAHDEFYTAEEHQIRYFDIDDAKLWTPMCQNIANLYEIKVFVNGRLDICEKFGIRTVKILQLKDKEGSPAHNLCLWLKEDSESADVYDANTEFSCFTLMINGKKIFCKGANWVPTEPFVSAVDPKKITRILEMSKDAGLNMIRVWGGGIFECDHFYSECDRLGIMVTQDFLMACGQYPEDEPHFVELLSKEAEYAAKKLRNHPCLMWWTGDNENAVNGSDKMSEYMGRISAHKAIAPALRKYDPRRRFLPSSPYGGDKYASKTVGTTHNTQYLGMVFPYIEKADMTDYKEYYEKYLARFVAEEPTMCACSYESLKEMMNDEDIFGGDPSQLPDMWYFHTQSNPALSLELMDYAKFFATKVLGDFTDQNDRFFKLKYMGYEWIRFTFENFRRNQYFSSGILYWMLNDCWPASAGWSFIDYYCRPKAIYYSFKRCAAHCMTSVIKRDGKFFARLCNDGYVADSGVVTCFAVMSDGSVQKCDEATVLFAANTVREIEISGVPQGAVAVICDYSSESFHDRSFYKDGALHISPCDGVAIDAITDDFITLTASRYVHAVEICGDGVFAENYFSMLPGETKKVGIKKLCGDISLTTYTLSEIV